LGRNGYIPEPQQQARTASLVDTGSFVSANVSLNTRTADATVSAPVGAQASHRPFRRAALIICGTLSLALGIVGIFVPLLPTTCFLLIAAWCYARSSSRLYDRLMNARWIGGYLRRYRDERSIPSHVKGASLVMMWITIGYSVYVFPNMLIRAALLLTAVGVTWHLYRLPSAK
jgi:uncharacterized membrane protein YbaN (DUF454 family)